MEIPEYNFDVMTDFIKQMFSTALVALWMPIMIYSSIRYNSLKINRSRIYRFAAPDFFLKKKNKKLLGKGVDISNKFVERARE